MQILGMTAHSRMIGVNYLRSDGQSHGTSRLTTKWKLNVTELLDASDFTEISKEFLIEFISMRIKRIKSTLNN